MQITDEPFKPNVPGGCIFIARKMLDSDLMSQSPLTLKLWIWMLLRASWRDCQQLARGQFVTTIADMQKAMSHYIGWRKITPTKDEIRNCYESLSRATRITTRKTTRGMVITIVNYDTYQDIETYEDHNEYLNENATKASAAPHDSKEREERKKKEIKKTYVDFFDSLWSDYPKRDGKKIALRHFTASVKNETDCQRIRKALDNYLAHVKENSTPQQFIKNGSTWFNNWQDWETVSKSMPVAADVKQDWVTPQESRTIRRTLEVYNAA